jgi:integrase
MSTRRIRNSWWVDFRVNYTRYRVRSPENSQAGAKAYEAVLRRRLTNGETLRPAPIPSAPTFAQFSNEWFETYVVTNNKPSSQKSRRRILDRHLVPFFGALHLPNIDTTKIERYKADKVAAGLSPKSVNLQLGVLSKCLRDAVEWGQLTAAPRIRWLRQPRARFDFLSQEEAGRLLAGMDEQPWRHMVALALHTGMRLGELFGLQWDDIDFVAHHLVVRRAIVEGVVGTTKNNRERQIPLSGLAIAALRARPREHRLVFCQKSGEPFTYGMAECAIDRGWQRAGLRSFGWHVLRHTFASWLVADGVPLPVVQGLLGHSTIEMTMRYSHLAPSAFRSAIRVLEERRTTSAPEYSWAAGGQQAMPETLEISVDLPLATPISSLN